VREVTLRPEAAALAATAAQKIAEAMETDGWPAARERLAVVLGQGDAIRRRQARDELENGRIALRNGKRTTRQVIAQWRHTLQLLLEDHPDAAIPLRRAFRDLSSVPATAPGRAASRPSSIAGRSRGTRRHRRRIGMMLGALGIVAVVVIAGVLTWHPSARSDRLAADSSHIPVDGNQAFAGNSARRVVQQYLTAADASDMATMATLQCRHLIQDGGVETNWLSQAIPDGQWRSREATWHVVGDRPLSDRYREVEVAVFGAASADRQSLYFFLVNESASWRLCFATDQPYEGQRLLDIEYLYERAAGG
jgi:hypothetical protein